MSTFDEKKYKGPPIACDSCKEISSGGICWTYASYYSSDGNFPPHFPFISRRCGKCLAHQKRSRKKELEAFPKF